MKIGKIFKNKSSWWYRKEVPSSIIVISTKHKTKKAAILDAWKDLDGKRIENLHVWQANGKYDGCYAICHAKGEQNV